MEEEHQDEFAGEPKSPLEILLETLPAEQRESVVKAWHEHVSADPQSIAAQWALIHFSLVAGMRDNTTRVSMLRTGFLKIQEELERKGGELTSEFRLEDSRTAAKMADYLKTIEEASQANLKNRKELEDEIKVLRNAAEVMEKAGDEARKSIREMENAVGGYFGMTAVLIMFLILCVGMALGYWLATR